MNFEQMAELINKLNYYTKLYDEGHPEISDKTWDEMYFQLQQAEQETGVVLANSPTHHINYQVVNALNKVTHSHIMASLSKTKSELDIINKFQNNDIIAMAKMDGLTCSLRYLNGKLISAETRGNGEIGEDITHNIFTVKGVPTQIPFLEELVVDGEIICTYTDFQKFSNQYANPRNFAAGSIRLLDSKECSQRDLTFVAWDCIKGLERCKTLSNKLYQLDQLGFLIVPFITLLSDTIDIEHIKHSIYLIKENAKDLQYPIDGLVFKIDDCEKYQNGGMTEHHPRMAEAFKFYDETYESTLKEIEWSMGRTGILTPIAVFEPIEIDGSIVSRASLHNVSIAKQILGSHPSTATKVKVYKANMIIPQIESAYTPDGWMAADINLWPLGCPVCGGRTDIINRDGVEIAICTNPDCEGKFINRLDHFVSKKGLDIKGFSKATLQKLINWEWVTSLKDIFRLYSYQNEWAKKDGFGSKSVMNILTAIEDAKECELWQFISALSIPLIGSTYAKQIAKKCESWEDFRNTSDFLMWDGFGPEMSSSLKQFNYEEADELVKNVLHLKNSLYNQDTIESDITGKTICITGKLKTYKNRNELKNVIEAHGGKVVDSVSSKTNYLVNNDINSTSSKNQKAKSLNIPIITEDELVAMF